MYLIRRTVLYKNLKNQMYRVYIAWTRLYGNILHLNSPYKNHPQDHPLNTLRLLSLRLHHRKHVQKSHKQTTKLRLSLSLSRMEKHSNSMNSPTATTFVQADTNTFRDLVQKLTGLSGDSDKLPVTVPSKLPSKPGDPTGPRRSPFKLHERRHTHTMRKLEIKLGLTNLAHSPSQTHRLDSPIQSPVTPLGSDSPFLPSSGTESPLSDEEKAIAGRGFYLHPSPLCTPRGTDPPELLTLFPLSSPSQKAPDS